MSTLGWRRLLLTLCGLAAIQAGVSLSMRYTSAYDSGSRQRPPLLLTSRMVLRAHSSSSELPYHPGAPQSAPGCEPVTSSMLVASGGRPLSLVHDVVAHRHSAGAGFTRQRATAHLNDHRTLSLFVGCVARLYRLLLDVAFRRLLSRGAVRAAPKPVCSHPYSYSITWETNFPMPGLRRGLRLMPHLLYLAGPFISRVSPCLRPMR